MNGFDPIQDTFHVFAGGKVKGTQRPGEQLLEHPVTSKRRPKKVGCNTIIQFITSSFVIALALVVMI